MTSRRAGAAGLSYGWILVLTLGVTEAVSWGVLNYFGRYDPGLWALVALTTAAAGAALLADRSEIDGRAPV